MTPAFRELDPVVLVRDVPEEHLRRGDLGTVVGVVGELLEVEFVTGTGRTRALVTLDVSTCGECLSDGNCPDGLICAPVFSFAAYSGARTCIPANSQLQDSYCDLENDGDLACVSGICSPADIMGLAQVGACGECQTDDDCGDGTCNPAMFDLGTGALTGSWCDA